MSPTARPLARIVVRRAELARRRRPGAAGDGGAAAPFCRRRTSRSRPCRRSRRSFAKTPTCGPTACSTLPSDRRRAVAALEGGGFDVGVLFPNSFRSAWSSAARGVPAAMGLCARAGAAAADARSRPPRRRGVVAPGRLLPGLVRGLGVAVRRRRAAAHGRSRAQRDARGAGAARAGSACSDGRAARRRSRPGAAYGQAKQWPPGSHGRGRRRGSSASVQATVRAASARRTIARRRVR